MELSKENIGVIIAILALVISVWSLMLAQKDDVDISQIKSLTTDIKNDTAGIKQELSQQYMIVTDLWFPVLAIVISILLFLIYMFYPSSKKNQTINMHNNLETENKPKKKERKKKQKKRETG